MPSPSPALPTPPDTLSGGASLASTGSPQDHSEEEQFQGTEEEKKVLEAFQGLTPVQFGERVLDVIYIRSLCYQDEDGNNNLSAAVSDADKATAVFRQASRRAKRLCAERMMHLLTCDVDERLEQEEDGCESGEEIEREMLRQIAIKSKAKFRMKPRKKKVPPTIIDLTDDSNESVPSPTSSTQSYSPPPEPEPKTVMPPLPKNSPMKPPPPPPEEDENPEWKLQPVEDNGVEGSSHKRIKRELLVPKGSDPIIIPAEGKGQAQEDPRRSQSGSNETPGKENDSAEEDPSGPSELCSEISMEEDEAPAMEDGQIQEDFDDISLPEDDVSAKAGGPSEEDCDDISLSEDDVPAKAAGQSEEDCDDISLSEEEDTAN